MLFVTTVGVPSKTYFIFEEAYDWSSNVSLTSTSDRLYVEFAMFGVPSFSDSEQELTGDGGCFSEYFLQILQAR